MDDYQQFLEGKKMRAIESGFSVPRESINSQLFDFQRDIVAWSLRRGRAAVFADCGLGKSPIQLTWGQHVVNHTGGDVLILAPLAVSKQTAREGAKFGVEVRICESQRDVRPGINITNYEKLHHFDPDKFVGVVIDEASILKSHSSKTRNHILSAFKHTPYRLAPTATPAPNDYMELGNQAEFLGIMSRTEMLSTFFVHDGGNTSQWRLKRHAEQEYWAWLASWAVNLRKPSDLGYSDDGFLLPPLEMHQHTVISDMAPEGMLFPVEARTLDERRKARRASLFRRVAECATLVNASDEPWVVWCDLNDEGDLLEKTIPGAVQIAGSDSAEFKEQAMIGFTEGTFRVLVTKPSIAGFGMNWQHCPNTAFVGLSDSYEMFYQAVRRFWRFGQTKTVHCHIFTSDLEGAVVRNIERKERDAARMAEEMVKHMAHINSAAVRGAVREQIEYAPTKPMALPSWVATQAA
jgi:hypothetical protein